MIDSDIAAAVAFAEVHTERCIRYQPFMRAELEAGLTNWNDRNLEHVKCAKRRPDYPEIVSKVRDVLEEQGALTVEHCQQVIQFMYSDERNIDARIREDDRTLPPGALGPQNTGSSNAS